jgi:lysophospholipase L1-like esterase
MTLRHTAFFLLATTLVCASAVRGQDLPNPIARIAPLQDGDRVLFLGDGFFEREHEFGSIETELTSLWPDRSITFRNLGRSGDTVWGDAWAAFDTAKEGFQRRLDLALQLEPTCIIIAFGMSESFDGPPGLARFETGLAALLDALAPAGARIVLLGPTLHYNLGPPLPDSAAHIQSLDLYRAAIARLAEKRNLGYIDMRLINGDGVWLRRHAGARLVTSDGIHLNADGYQLAARVFAIALGRSDRRWWEVWLRAGDRLSVQSARGAYVHPLSDAGLQFKVIDAKLPSPPLPGGAVGIAADERRLRVTDLVQETYALTIDGMEVASGKARDWARNIDVTRGIPIDDCPERRQAEQLRQAIVHKNRLLYYRWRPENETYLYGFRKHEQGNNAVEMPQFDPLVAHEEAEIARLRVPVPHLYELLRTEEAR